MSYKLPYPYLPNLGALQSGDIIPALREPFDEGSMTVGDLTNFISPAKKYFASFTQTGTNNPIVNTIWENTIGNIVWTYDGIGTYNGYLDDGFVGDMPIIEGVYGMYNVNVARYYTIFKVDDSNIRLLSYDNNINIGDDLLFKTFIQILLYPVLP